jgi:hypothetical protein
VERQSRRFVQDPEEEINTIGVLAVALPTTAAEVDGEALLLAVEEVHIRDEEEDGEDVGA